MHNFKNAISFSIERLQKRLFEALDHRTGSWCGRHWMSVHLTAEYLLLLKYLGMEEEEARIGMALLEIQSQQNEDGGFPAYAGGPSEPSISSICHLALDLYSHKVDRGVFQKAQHYMDEQVDHRKTLLIARFYRFLFGKLGMKGLPQIRPELILWPKWTGVSIYDVASWVRSWLVPISILWHTEKYNPERKDRTRIRFYLPFLRNAGIRKTEKWIIDHQDTDGSWYGVFSSTMISLMALYKLGYSLNDEPMIKGLAFIHSLQDQYEGRLRQQPFLGPVWDTAHAVLALEEDLGEPFTETARRSTRFLLKKQIPEKGDWSVNNRSKPGGWPFEFINRHYPDVDDSALVLRSLSRLGLNQDHPQIEAGLQWLLSMQNRNGSWAAFDKNNHKPLPEWYLNFRNYYIGNGPGLILDRGTPDVTAHVLESLAPFNFPDKERTIHRTIRWLRKKQEKDGSWFGRWGLCYLYGTSAVLTALMATGQDPEEEYIQDAIRFLKKNQNSDGGFGEVPEAYFDPAKKGKGPSDPTQTAWVVMALDATCEYSSSTLIRAVGYLIDQLQPDGNYPSVRFHAVAAPPLYQKYELYPVYFPLMALKNYLKSLYRSPFTFPENPDQPNAVD
jgi:squalene-hopene/tetraprenyl-beta-curcumene cyclase